MNDIMIIIILIVLIFKRIHNFIIPCINQYLMKHTINNVRNYNKL